MTATRSSQPARPDSHTPNPPCWYCGKKPAPKKRGPFACCWECWHWWNEQTQPVCGVDIPCEICSAALARARGEGGA